MCPAEKWDFGTEWSLCGRTGNRPAASLYLVPYAMEGNGTIVLPVQHLDMKVGDRLVLIGAQPEKTADIIPEDGLFQKAEDTPEGENILFTAGQAGEERIALRYEANQTVLQVNVRE